MGVVEEWGVSGGLLSNPSRLTSSVQERVQRPPAWDTPSSSHPSTSRKCRIRSRALLETQASRGAWRAEA